jgi:hypothetical protein
MADASGVYLSLYPFVFIILKNIQYEHPGGPRRHHDVTMTVFLSHERLFRSFYLPPKFVTLDPPFEESTKHKNFTPNYF